MVSFRISPSTRLLSCLIHTVLQSDPTTRDMPPQSRFMRFPRYRVSVVLSCFPGPASACPALSRTPFPFPFGSPFPSHPTLFPRSVSFSSLSAVLFCKNHDIETVSVGEIFLVNCDPRILSSVADFRDGPHKHWLRMRWEKDRSRAIFLGLVATPRSIDLARNCCLTCRGRNAGGSIIRRGSCPTVGNTKFSNSQVGRS